MVEGGEITVITVVNKAFRDGWGSLDEKKKKKSRVCYIQEGIVKFEVIKGKKGSAKFLLLIPHRNLLYDDSFFDEEKFLSNRSQMELQL